MIKRKPAKKVIAKNVAPKADKKVIKKPAAAKTSKVVKRKEEVASRTTRKAVKVKSPTKGQLVKIMAAVTEKLQTVNVDVIVASINAASAASVSTGKGKGKAKPTGVSFERVTKDFGFQLRHKFDTKELKAAFKDALARAPKELGIKMGMFNKLFPTDSGELFIIAGLKKSKGDWVFSGYNAAGKRESASAEVPF